MNLLRFFLGASRPTVGMATLAGLAGGLCSAALIAVINTALHSERDSMTLLIWLFAALVIAKIAASACARILLTRYTQQRVAGLRRELSRRILAAPLRQLETIGVHRLLATLTDDVQTLRLALQQVPMIIVNVAILFGGALYLGWLSWPVLLGVGALVAVGAWGYRPFIRGAMAFLRRVREQQDTLFGHFRAMTEGVKELKLHRGRREEFLSHSLYPTTETLKEHQVAATTRFIAGQSWSHILFFAVLGMLLFALPALTDIDASTMTGYVLTILYLLGPMTSVTSVLPMFGPASVALQKVENLGLSLGESTLPNCDALPAPLNTWRELCIAGAAYIYEHETGDRDFVLGPIDLTVRPGELVFVVGGNGSGKSTFAKVVSGLYPPTAGTIELDGQPITESNREWYRQHFSMVFSDCHLFESLLGLSGAAVDEDAKRYLARLDLERKVEIEGKVFSTTALSRGQQKRLALLTAYLEDRPIYIFDEWAADQDPQFKAVFYKELLTDLKRRGKAVLVISHDEHYYHLADRVLKLDDGKLTKKRGQFT